MMNELQLSYPEEIVTREVITELFHYGALTPKDYVKFMRYSTQLSPTFMFDKLNTFLDKQEKEENNNERN